jgi:hypothetical protein
MAHKSRCLHVLYVFFLAFFDVQLLITRQLWPPSARFGLHLSGFVELELRVCLKLDSA